jgi:hypothetical protein
MVGFGVLDDVDIVLLAQRIPNIHTHNSTFLHTLSTSTSEPNIHFKRDKKYVVVENSVLFTIKSSQSEMPTKIAIKLSTTVSTSCVSKD